MLTFVNGVNDASHSIASVVETRARAPLEAGVSSAIANFIALFIFTAAVTATFLYRAGGPGCYDPALSRDSDAGLEHAHPCCHPYRAAVSGSHAVVAGYRGQEWLLLVYLLFFFPGINDDQGPRPLLSLVRESDP